MGGGQATVPVPDADLPEAYRGVVRDELLTSLCEAVEPAMTPEEFARAVEKIGVFVVEDEEPEPDDVPREASTSPLMPFTATPWRTT